MKAEDLGLLTDLYELTMAQSYFQNGMFAPATFSLHIRKYPPDRGYLVAAGLEDVLNYLQEWSFSGEAIDYLRSTGIFAPDFLEFLPRLRFTGDVWAIPEGHLFFPDEPILEVTAPVIEAQAVETLIINHIHFQSLVATKAARCTWAARDREVTDFSLRRTPGIDAGMKVARACYIGGFPSTSNVLAGKLYGMPPSGTMAHSFVTGFPTEEEAFRAYGLSFPQRSIFLIDTYDTAAGAAVAVKVAKEMEARGDRLFGVRLDSGDFATLSRQVRSILDEAGLHYVKIVASGGLDEYDVAGLVEGGAPIDIFGVGTKVGVSADAPYSDIVYKMVQFEGRPVMKLSEGKISLPGEKQVYRVTDERGTYSRDVIALRDDVGVEGEPLLQKVMEGGRMIGRAPSLEEMRQCLEDDLSRLGEEYKALRDPPAYPVTLTPELDRLLRMMEEELRPEGDATEGEGRR